MNNGDGTSLKSRVKFSYYDADFVKQFLMFNEDENFAKKKNEQIIIGLAENQLDQIAEEFNQCEQKEPE